MAIAIDSSSQLASDTGSTPTWSHTCTGSNLVLIVGVEVATGETVSSVTYAGTSMTQINTQNLSGATFGNVYLFRLFNPAAGANNIIVTKSSTSFGYCAAASYTGVSSTLDVNTTTSTTGTSITGTLITTVDNDWLVGFVSAGTSGDTGTMTAGTNTTARQTNINNWYTFVDTNAAQTPLGSKSMVVNHSTSVLLGFNLVAISPFTGSTALVTTRSLLGVGK
jgi:hypothetical protein